MRWWILSRNNLESIGIDLDEDKEVDRILNKFYGEKKKGSKSQQEKEEEDFEFDYDFYFESYDEEVYLSWINNTIFWVSELTSAAIWAFIFVIEILGLELLWVFFLIFNTVF